MKMRAEDFGSRSSFSVPNGTSRRGVIFGVFVIVVCDIQIVNFVARLFQHQKRFCHVELDIIQIHTDNNGGFLRHVKTLKK